MAQNSIPYSITVTVDGITSQFGGTLSADSYPQIRDVIAISTTNKEYDTLVDVSGLQGWFLLAVGGNLTLKTNSSGSPDNTITLVDGKAQFWITGTGPDNSLDTDITKWYVTNASGVVTPQLYILPIVDNSP